MSQSALPDENQTGKGRWRVLVLLSLAELLAMSLWFSASAVVPALRAEWNLTESAAGWLTIAVQLGFVCGTLLSAFINLPDIVRARKLFTVAAVAGAVANACFALYAHDVVTGILLRFMTGMCLAGVYPPGMKIMAGWFRRSRGMALGVLVGALTVGKAAPYLINGLGSSQWRYNVLFASLLAASGGLLVFFFVGEGPYELARVKFDWTQAINILRNRAVRLANLGYLGHMWELYAMWTWTPIMIRASLASRGVDPRLAEVAAFLVIGCGALGCVVAGLIADRVGRTAVTSWAMAISGSCCLAIGLFYGAHPFWLLVLAAVWGASVVADSAQFSTCVTELGEPRYIGTALTMQTCLGFLLTTISIELVPKFQRLVSWRYAFVILAPGPLLGVGAMLRLRQLPEAVRIAHGKR